MDQFDLVYNQMFENFEKNQEDFIIKCLKQNISYLYDLFTDQMKLVTVLNDNRYIDVVLKDADKQIYYLFNGNFSVQFQCILNYDGEQKSDINIKCDDNNILNIFKNPIEIQKKKFVIDFQDLQKKQRQQNMLEYMLYFRNKNG